MNYKRLFFGTLAALALTLAFTVHFSTPDASAQAQSGYARTPEKKIVAISSAYDPKKKGFRDILVTEDGYIYVRGGDRETWGLDSAPFQNNDFGPN